MFGRSCPKRASSLTSSMPMSKKPCLGGEALKALMTALNDSPEKATALAAEIHVIESRADKITYETVSCCTPRSSPRWIATKFTA
jgi:hypothetical protein